MSQVQGLIMKYGYVSSTLHHRILDSWERNTAHKSGRQSTILYPTSYTVQENIRSSMYVGTGVIESSRQAI
jgi:hypothetical protein